MSVYSDVLHPRDDGGRFRYRDHAEQPAGRDVLTPVPGSALFRDGRPTVTEEQFDEQIRRWNSGGGRRMGWGEYVLDNNGAGFDIYQDGELVGEYVGVVDDGADVWQELSDEDIAQIIAEETQMYAEIHGDIDPDGPALYDSLLDPLSDMSDDSGRVRVEHRSHESGPTDVWVALEAENEMSF